MRQENWGQKIFIYINVSLERLDSFSRGVSKPKKLAQ